MTQNVLSLNRKRQIMKENDMTQNEQFFTSCDEYIAVLQTEVETLRRYYYKPEGSATGHYNTAISVLEERIKELKATRLPYQYEVA